jgi:hypothetical protein
MSEKAQTYRRYLTLSDRDWDALVDLYERGHESYSGLARLSGMSKQGIAAGLKKRGAVQGRRMHELLVPLEHAIGKAQVQRSTLQILNMQAHSRLIEFMYDALVADSKDEGGKLLRTQQALATILPPLHKSPARSKC